MTAPVGVTFNQDHTRTAFTLFDEKGNIITAGMVAALRAALVGLSSNPALKLITLEGAGADFSFGASIPEHAADRIADVLPAMHRLIEDLLHAPAVTAAVVRGRCLGGGFELALACDFIFAADDAVFGLPEVALGVFPPAASALLPLRIGASRATRAIVTGASAGAADWQETGLLELVVPRAGLSAEVDRWFAKHLAPKSAAALRHAAAAARTEISARVRQTLPVLERLYLNDLMRTHDAVEGIAAFNDRRPPVLGKPVTFDVEIVLRERAYAVTERIHQAGDPREWTEPDVAAVLREILLAIDRAKNPAATDRYVALRGFSWIVEPADGGVVIAIEIPSGAAVAGPFDIEQPALDRMISRVLTSDSPRTVVH